MARRALKVCGWDRCPVLVEQGRCDEHRRLADRRRGRRQDRGYDAEHYRIRKQWAPKVDAGQVECHARECLLPSRLIETGTAWDLGHTEDRSTWTGPEHQLCNRSAGGRAAHAL
jgi:hypothetical protein